MVNTFAESVDLKCYHHKKERKKERMKERKKERREGRKKEEGSVIGRTPLTPFGGFLFP